MGSVGPSASCSRVTKGSLSMSHSSAPDAPRHRRGRLAAAVQFARTAHARYRTGMKPSIKASVTACVMCGEPLPAWRPLQGVLCRSPRCAGRHAALPPQASCSQCTRPITSAQRAWGHCDSTLCRDEARRDRAAAEAERREAAAAALRRRRRRSAAQRGISDDEQATYRIAVLPYNADRISRLPAARRASHEAHLRRCLAEARQVIATQPAAPPAGAPTAAAPAARESSTQPVGADERQHAESQLLLTACAACRGACCRQAGDHAFVSAEQMTAYLRRHPTCQRRRGRGAVPCAHRRADHDAWLRVPG